MKSGFEPSGMFLKLLVSTYTYNEIWHIDAVFKFTVYFHKFWQLFGSKYGEFQVDKYLVWANLLHRVVKVFNFKFFHNTSGAKGMGMKGKEITFHCVKFDSYYY